MNAPLSKKRKREGAMKMCGSEKEKKRESLEIWGGTRGKGCKYIFKQRGEEL